MTYSSPNFLFSTNATFFLNLFLYHLCHPPIKRYIPHPGTKYQPALSTIFPRTPSCNFLCFNATTELGSKTQASYQARLSINSFTKLKQNQIHTFFLKKIIYLFIYLTERDIAREGTKAGGVGEGEAGFPLNREPDVGLNPRTRS